MALKSECESHLVMSDSLRPHGLMHGILQARILEWAAFPFSRGSSQPRDRPQVSCIAGINGTEEGILKKWQLRYYLNVQLSSSNIFIQSKVPFESICPYCEAYFTLNNVSILSRIHGSSHNVWKYVSSNTQIWKNHRIGITHSKPLDVKMIKGRPRQEAWLGTSSTHCFFELCARHCA